MPSSPLVIRPERPDQPEVVALLDSLDEYLRALYPPEANHILDVAALLAPDVTFLVARRGGVAVGTGACRRMPGEPETGGQAYGEIKRMVVQPEHRGQGIAARLLRSLEDTLRADGLRWALLETGRDQAQAVHLYRRCGYAPRRAFGGYADNGLSLFLAKPL
jgi:putative acetyltransferase